MSLILATLALLSPPLPRDPAWYRVAGDDDLIMYVEASSIVTEGDSKTALTLSAYAQPTASGAYFVAVTVGYDCSGGRYRDLDFAFLDANGKVIRTEEARSGLEYRSPKPGSYNDQLIRFVCYGTGGTRISNPLEDAEGYFTH